MGTEIATLLSAVPNTNWVNATFLWVTSQWSITGASAKGSIPNPTLGRLVPVFAACVEFPASRGSYLSPFLKRLGATR